MRRDSAPAVSAYERGAGPVRAVSRRVALPRRAAAVDGDVQQRRAVEGCAHDHLSHVHVLAAAGGLPVEQGGQGVEGDVHAAGIVQVRPAPTRRRFVGQPGREGHAGQRLGGRAECGVVLVAAGMAESGHGHVDDVLTQLPELVVAKAPVLEHRRAVVLHHRVRHGNEPADDVHAPWAAYVQGQAHLVGVGVVEAASGVQRWRDAGWRPCGASGPAELPQGPLDLYDLRAECAQPSRSPGAGAHPREVDDAAAIQRPGVGLRLSRGLSHGHLHYMGAFSRVDKLCVRYS